MATATPSTLNIAVLAAGEGKRMRSSVPKVLRLLAGRPLLAHILETARELAPDRICVVYGHGGDAVRERRAVGGLAHGVPEVVEATVPVEADSDGAEPGTLDGSRWICPSSSSER